MNKVFVVMAEYDVGRDKPVCLLATPDKKKAEDFVKQKEHFHNKVTEIQEIMSVWTIENPNWNFETHDKFLIEKVLPSMQMTKEEIDLFLTGIDNTLYTIEEVRFLP